MFSKDTQFWKFALCDVTKVGDTATKLATTTTGARDEKFVELKTSRTENILKKKAITQLPLPAPLPRPKSGIIPALHREVPRGFPV